MHRIERDKHVARCLRRGRARIAARRDADVAEIGDVRAAECEIDCIVHRDITIA